MPRCNKPLSALSLRLSTLSVLSAALCVPLLTPNRAEACGGTFCDAGTGMPVDQTGENILFVVDGKRTDAHIQIQYDPDAEAEQFAWVIPVMDIPDFSVGSEQLFINLLDASVPTYNNRTWSVCDDSTDSEGSFTGEDGTEETTETTDTDGDEDPKVVKEESVGAYDITVIEGGTPDSVMTWLSANGFAQDELARPILAAYLAENFRFVALKLKNQAEVDEIQPIVLSFDNQGPCVPLRLTRIAAVEDMEVRTFFLSNARVVPENYRHVEVNPLKIDWLNFADNYKEVVAMAVDAEHAEGNAFVTEYAGTSNRVRRAGLFSDSWQPGEIALLQAKPTELVKTLTDQGLMYCWESTWQGWVCEYYHPLLLPLLHTYMPVPEGVAEAEFYGCLECFADQIDRDAWWAGRFADDMRERIVDPGKNALDLLERHSYLTRMYTLISPDEMNVDPEFVTASNLPDVANIRRSTQQFDCEGNSVVTLPDGRTVHIPEGSGWPEFTKDMPDEERVDRSDSKGELTQLSSRTSQIDALLAEWNALHNDSDAGTETDDTTGGTDTAEGTTEGQTGAGDETQGSGTTGDSASTSTSGGGGSTTGSAETTGTPGTTTGGVTSGGTTGGLDTTGPSQLDVGGNATGEDPSVSDSGTGCACRSVQQPAAGGLSWLALLALVGLRRRQPRG